MRRLWLILLFALPLQGEGPLQFYSNAPLVLSKDQIRDIFLGRLFEISKVPVHPLVQSGGRDHELFLEGYISKNASEFKRHWKQMLFSGKATPPPVVEQAQEGFELLLSKKEGDRAVWLIYSTTEEPPVGVHRVEVTR